MSINNAFSSVPKLSLRNFFHNRAKIFQSSVRSMSAGSYRRKELVCSRQFRAELRLVAAFFRSPRTKSARPMFQFLVFISALSRFVDLARYLLAVSISLFESANLR